MVRDRSRTFNWAGQKSLTILDEDALVLRARALTHMNHDILNAGRLRGGPVNPSCRRGRGDIGQVKNEVPNLTEEHIRRTPALVTIALVLITIDQAHAGEAGSRLNDSRRIGIANQLSVIIINDRRRNQISSSGEINNGRSGGRGLAARRPEPAAIADGLVDRRGVISHTIA